MNKMMLSFLPILLFACVATTHHTVNPNGLTTFIDFLPTRFDTWYLDFKYPIDIYNENPIKVSGVNINRNFTANLIQFRDELYYKLKANDIDVDIEYERKNCLKILIHPVPVGYAHNGFTYDLIDITIYDNNDNLMYRIKINNMDQSIGAYNAEKILDLTAQEILKIIKPAA